MSFKKELLQLSAELKSEKLELAKKMLRIKASEGNSSAILYPCTYDDIVVSWLKAQGFIVEEVSNQRDGDFLRVDWSDKKEIYE